MVPENDSFQKGPFSGENHVKLPGLWHEHFVKHLGSLSQTNMPENNNDCSCHCAIHLESQRSFWVNDLFGSRYTLLQSLWCRRMASFFADSTFSPLLFDRPPKKSQKTVNTKKFRRFYHKKNTKSGSSPSHFVSCSLSDFDLPCSEQVKDAFCLKWRGTPLDHNIKVFLTYPPLSITLHSVFDDLLNLWNFNIPKISDASKLEIFLYKNVPLIIWPTKFR